MENKGLIISLLTIIFGLVGYIVFSSNDNVSNGNLTEEELELFFREHTIANNNAVAIKIDFTIPQPGTAYLGTIHGYPNNRSVCEELIAPYNEDPSLTTIPGGTYYCEVLRPQ